MLVPTIGVEVHVELKSKTKIFSPSLNDFNSAVNSNVNVIDLGYPGVLPRLNKEAVLMALKAAIVLNCEITRHMHFDRKNYFYPDLPKGYQITQARTPIGHDGYVEIEIDGKIKKIEIERIHMEEDTCKSIHVGKETLLNYNRAGVPLIEIVTKPVISSSKEAVLYLEALREKLLYLGISDVKIEEGSMRCDANISLKEEGSSILGTKTEIKNIGSIRNVGVSIDYEINRQKEILENGGVIKEETRRFDDKTNTTVLMRVKETGHDYRYFPEPDIPYLTLPEEWIIKARKSIPVLPEELRKKYREMGLNTNSIETLLSNKPLCDFFENVSKFDAVTAANLLTGEVLSYLNKNHLSFKETKLNKENFLSLLSFLKEGKISSKQGKEVLAILLEQDKKVEDIIQDMGMEQISDASFLQQIVLKVIENNPESVEDYKNGKDRAIKFLMGQIMKESKGKANPKQVDELLKNTLQTL